MEYHAMINLLDSTSNQPSRFRTKNWVKIYDNLCGTCTINIQIKFETSVLKSSLYDDSEA